MTSVFQGLSLSCSVGRVGENPGNKVAFSADSFCANVLEQVPNHRLRKRRQFLGRAGGGRLYKLPKKVKQPYFTPITRDSNN